MREYIVLLCSLCVFSTSAFELSLVPGFKDQEWAERVEFHGFLTQAWMNTTKNNYMANDTVGGSFAWTEIGFNASMQVTDNLRVGGQIFVQDLGRYGNWEATIDWLYASYYFTDWFNLKVGKIKLANGLLGEYRDLNFTFPWAILPPGYSFNSRAFSTSVWGAGVYGNVSIGKAGSIEYELFYGTRKIDVDDAASVNAENLYSRNFGPTEADSWDVSCMYGGKLYWNTPLEGLSLSATTIRVDLSANLKAAFGDIYAEYQGYWLSKFSAKYQLEKLTTTLEYSREYMGDGEMTIPVFAMDVKIPRYDKESWYVACSYQITDSFIVSAYYGVTESREDRDLKGTFLRDAAVNLQYWIKEYWNIKLEAHAYDGTSKLLDFNNLDGLEKQWYQFIVKTSINF